MLVSLVKCICHPEHSRRILIFYDFLTFIFALMQKRTKKIKRKQHARCFRRLLRELTLVSTCRIAVSSKFYVVIFHCVESMEDGIKYQTISSFVLHRWEVWLLLQVALCF